MKIVLVSILFVGFSSFAQVDKGEGDQDIGIKWEKAGSWGDIKEKAKRENKFIFVDCYTTWCGPCKKMDAEVYIQNDVGDFMNEKFLNVRVQMDKTKNDEPVVRRWYGEAENMQQRYKVLVFPSYLFFNPQGQLIHRDASYATPEKFIELAQKAFDPGSQYYTLKAEYEGGNKNYGRMQYLINKGLLFGDFSFVEKLKVDYLKHLETQPSNVINTKDNIEFIASAIPDTKSPWFKMFIRKSSKINKLMGQAGFARRAVDSAIVREYINPVFNKLQPKQSPNWDSMFTCIQKSFGTTYARRNIGLQQAKWYEKVGDKKKYIKYFIDFVAADGMDTSYYYSDIEINAFAYIEVLKMNPNLLKVSGPILDSAINMMAGVVDRAGRIMIHLGEGDLANDTLFTTRWKAMKIDTYAGLLYKAGRREEAISWARDALQIMKSIGEKARSVVYEKTLNSMLAGSY